MVSYESLHREINTLGLYQLLWSDAMDKDIEEINRIFANSTSDIYFVWGPYSTLKQRLENVDVEQQMETIAHLKAYIKKRNSPLWAWAIIYSIASSLVALLMDELPEGETLLCGLDYSALFTVFIIIACLVCLCCRIHASEKNEYLLSIVESVEKYYMTKWELGATKEDKRQ